MGPTPTPTAPRTQTRSLSFVTELSGLWLDA